MSILDDDLHAGKGATAPRVSLADMEGKIAQTYHLTGNQAVGLAPNGDSLSVLSICILVMNNGYTIIGKSAPASAANFDQDLGRRLAYEDALRQLWPLEGYHLRTQLADAANA